ncbi:MAG TPA: hypothetical protein VM123_10730 [archaeon]|nr:hypothetical protein [archaeon]
MSIRLTLSVLLAFMISLAGPCTGAEVFNPYRVLLVIGNQWQDQSSFLIDIPASEGLNYDFTYRPEGTDFMQLVVMLKSWGIPFDILRLDQQSLDINHFLGPDNKPSYGCILWAADPQAGLASQDYSVLREAVKTHGISLVALSNRINQPVLEELLGLRYIAYNMTHDNITTDGIHYLTRGMSPAITPLENAGYSHRARVEALSGVQVLASQGKYPALTLRNLESGARAIWIGGDYGIMFDRQNLRTVLRRAITCAVGYSLFKTWENNVVIVMDDPGGAQCAWLDSWHYPTLSQDEIRKHLIAPLKKHRARLVLNVIPGFVNDRKRRVELAFQQDFTDQFGVRQDFVSTKRGLDEGLREGVLEIQSHGWTHMQPDLDSPPGPWWGAPLDGEKAEVGWYREFGDTRRGFTEIPAAIQTFRMKTGIRWLKHLFEIDPLSFVSGGGGVSLSYPNHTWILAARAGFGWFCWFGGYLGPDMAVRRWLFEGTPEAPQTLGAMPDSHDKGIAEHPEEFLKTFEKAGPRAIYIGLNEYIGYLHAGRQCESPRGLEVDYNYDPHYCQFFRTSQSAWQLDLADWAREKLAGKTILVDGTSPGKVAPKGIQEIRIPAGTGRHTVAIR